MHAAVAPFAAEQFHHADGGGGRRRRRRDSGAMLAAGASLSAPTSTMAATSRCILRRGERLTVGLVDRPDRPRPDAHHGHRRRRPGARHCDQRPPRPQLFARHCRCRHRAGADRVAGRCRRHHHCQCGRSARTSRRSSAARPAICSPTAISARAWSPAVSAHCPDHRDRRRAGGGRGARGVARRRLDRRRGIASAWRDRRGGSKTAAPARRSAIHRRHAGARDHA